MSLHRTWRFNGRFKSKCAKPKSIQKSLHFRCLLLLQKNNLMVIMLMRRMLLQNVRAIIRRVHKVLFGLWFRLLSSNCSMNFLFKIFFQISFRYYSQAHYQIEWLFVSSLVQFTCNSNNTICFQYRQTVDEYLAHSKYERAYLTWKCTFIYVRMEFGWHARKCFDVVIFFFLSHSIHCIHERPISIDRKKTVKFGPFFFSIYCLVRTDFIEVRVVHFQLIAVCVTHTHISYAIEKKGTFPLA